MNSILPKGWILQWDNDSKHKSNDSLYFYIKNKIKLMKWPAYCPDLNPIENIWEALSIISDQEHFQVYQVKKRRLKIGGIKLIINFVEDW